MIATRTALCLWLSVAAAGPLPLHAEPAQTEIVLEVLGSGGPELDDGRASSGYLLWQDGKARLLVDAGPGVSTAFGRSGARFADLDAVLLTHLHVDHAADLPAFVKGSFFSQRARPLPVYGPAGNDLMPGTRDYLQRLFGPAGAFRYLLDFLEQEEPGAYVVTGTDVPLARGEVWRQRLDDDLEVLAVRVHHGPVAAVAWRVNLAGRSVTFSGDMSNRFDVFSGLAAGSDLIVLHNAVPEDAGRIARNLHMPPSEIGKIAAAAAAGRVLLSHRMNRTLGREDETLSLVRKHYRGEVEFADDGDRVPL